MKQIFLAVTVLLATSMTFAQSRYSSPSSSTYSSSSYSSSSYGSSNSLTALLGFKSTATVFGVNYENQGYGTLGIGGYLLFASEKDDAGVQQVTSLGVIAPMHILDDSRVSVYLAPGFGVHMIKALNPNGEDVTTFGPAFKTGALFKVSGSVKVGAEYTQLFNWFSDKAGSEYSFMNVALNFSL